MKTNWTTTKLIVAGSLGALSVALQLFGSGIAAVVGIPMFGGVVNIFIAPALIMICLFVVNQFGAATTMYLVASILALPFHLSGTPGFLPKVPIGLIEGLIADVLFHFLKKNQKMASLIIGALTMLYVSIAVIEVGKRFNMPGIEQTAKLVYKLVYSPFLIPGLIIPAFGGYLGYLIYQKIKNTSVVKRIQA